MFINSPSYTESVKEQFGLGYFGSARFSLSTEVGFISIGSLISGQSGFEFAMGDISFLCIQCAQ